MNPEQEIINDLKTMIGLWSKCLKITRQIWELTGNDAVFTERLVDLEERMLRVSGSPDSSPTASELAVPR